MRKKVFIVCTGVGHINRGYESFTIECFESLKQSDNFELFLLKGGGKSERHQIKIPCIKRNSKAANGLSKLLKKEKYWIEEFTFLLGMIPTLIKHKPSVIYYSDFILGTFLWHFRRFAKFKYKLLFSNGAPNGPPFKTEDHVQQLIPKYLNEAIINGENRDKQTLLPYGFNIKKNYRFVNDSQKKMLQKKYFLPENKKIIISVGAINSYHKRMDYVINEFSHLNNEEYYLLLLGQIDDKSFSIIELAKKTLIKNSYSIKQVSPDEVSVYLSLSDYFILGSLSEGFGRVLIEALRFGLLPIVHDYDVVHQVLGNYGIYANLTKQGILENLIKVVDNSSLKKNDLLNFAYENYSWEKLAPQYETMISKLF